jgi:hypothetical protein
MGDALVGTNGFCFVAIISTRSPVRKNPQLASAAAETADTTLKPLKKASVILRSEAQKDLYLNRHSTSHL